MSDDPGPGDDFASARIEALDRSGMFGHISAVGRELVSAWASARELEPPLAARSARQVVVAAMGGSATAGDYFEALAREHSAIPVSVVRDSSLPDWVSEESFVIVSSYSGNTEETLACYDDAWKRGASLLAMTCGGALAERARDDGVPLHRIRYESPPRAAVAHGLGPLLALGRALDLVAVDEAAVRAAASRHAELVERELGLAVPPGTNGAKTFAAMLLGRTPFIVGAGHLAPAARRFKNQLAENAKMLAAAEALPEAGHNWVCGLDHAPRAAAAVVTLESRRLFPATLQRRFEALARECAEAGVPVLRIDTAGATTLEDLLLATAWGDFVSCYLAILQGIDPTPIPHIERMRQA